MPYKTYQTPPKDAADMEATEVEEVKQEDDEVKNELMEEEVTESENGQDDEVNTENGESKKRPWPQRVKEGGVKKLPKDVLKRRRNFRLKKMVVPKAPVMILHELIGTIQYEISDPIAPPVKNMPTIYTARVTHEGLEFVGNGPSKSVAKNIAAEQVLQHITTQSCRSSSQDTMETDTPWSALASLAMFKLFNDWQAQGYLLPQELARGLGPNPGDPPTDGERTQKQKKEKQEKEKPMKTLPENYMDKHPVQLLNEMKGPLEYQETGCEGQPPNCVFTLSVQIEDLTFSGQGRSKKEAKKAAAQSALGRFYNLQFPSS